MTREKNARTPTRTSSSVVSALVDLYLKCRLSFFFHSEHFPYFNTAPSGWKNSVRHNLSLNKSFEKIENPQTSNNQRKGCLWAINPERAAKMDEEILKSSRKDIMGIKKGMANPGKHSHSFWKSCMVLSVTNTFILLLPQPTLSSWSGER